MARIVKEKEYAARRNEILDVAQRLVYTQGYEQMSIQDILDEMRISKGAFYHYFDSKPALLESLIERMIDQGEQLLAPVVQDPSLRALDKLQCYFDAAGRWKTARKDYLLALARGWYTDNNAIVRQKMFAQAMRRVAPFIAAILRQGVQEGVFSTPYPELASEMILALLQSFGDALTLMILAAEPGSRALCSAEDHVAAYTDGVERILGAPPASLRLIEAGILEEWFTAARRKPEAADEALPSGMQPA